MKAQIVLAALVLLVTLGLRPAAAFEPPNDRYYAYVGLNRVWPAVAESGELRWRATDLYGWSTWREVVRRALDTGSDYPQSIGNLLASQALVREAEPAMIEHFAVSTGFVEGKCGGSFATACVYLLNPLPVPAYYKAAAMITWSFVPQAAVVQHETWHPFAQACDQYQGGCPPTESLPLLCRSNPDTLMDCASAARYPQFFDLVTFAVLYVPAPIEGGVLREDLGAVFYGAVPANPARIMPATRTAVFIQTAGFPLAFVGRYGSVGAAAGIYGATVPILPCTAYYVAPENALPLTWGGRAGLTLVGATGGCTP